MTTYTSRAEAIVAGAVKYSTGRPCVRGHVAERWAHGGTCTECQRSWQKATNARYYAKNRIKELSRKAHRRAQNPEHVREIERRASRSWSAANRSRRSAFNARRRAVKLMAIPLRWLVGDTIGDQSRTWDEMDRRVRAYRAARAVGDKSVGLRVADLIRPAFADMLADWNETLESCELLLGVKLTLDHCQPISKLGEDSIENWFPLTKSQNSSKGDRSMVEWQSRPGFRPTFEAVTPLASEPTD